MARTVRNLPTWIDWEGAEAVLTRDGMTRTHNYKSPTEHLGDFYGEGLYAPGTGKAVRRQLNRRGRYAARQELRDFLRV